MGSYGIHSVDCESIISSVLNTLALLFGSSLHMYVPRICLRLGQAPKLWNVSLGLVHMHNNQACIGSDIEFGFNVCSLFRSFFFMVLVMESSAGMSFTT